MAENEETVPNEEQNPDVPAEETADAGETPAAEPSLDDVAAEAPAEDAGGMDIPDVGGGDVDMSGLASGLGEEPGMLGMGDDSDVVGYPAKFPRMDPESDTDHPAGVDIILDVSTTVSVELGRSSMIIKEVLELGPGSIIELNKLAGEPVDVLVNDKLIAKGEVIVINENFGVRITEVLGPEQRIKSLGGSKE